MESYDKLIHQVLSTGKPKVSRGCKTMATNVGIFRHDFQDIPTELRQGHPEDLTYTTIPDSQSSLYRLPNHYPFPLITAKHVSLLTVARELWCFVNGITSKSLMQSMKLNIWDEWCNPAGLQRILPGWATAILSSGKPDLAVDPPSAHSLYASAISLQATMQRSWDDLGYIYGWQWRRFNEHIAQNMFREHLGNADRLTTSRTKNKPSLPGHLPRPDNTDQLACVLHDLVYDIHSRRQIVSAWNPSQLSEMALPPCHLLWQVNVIENVLHLTWYQRSCDLMLGVPYNIASYALLQLLLCQHASEQRKVMLGHLASARSSKWTYAEHELFASLQAHTEIVPGELTGILTDLHIYAEPGCVRHGKTIKSCNHFDKVEEYLALPRHPLPVVSFGEQRTDLQNVKPFDLLDWEPSQFELAGYQKYTESRNFPLEIFV